MRFVCVTKSVHMPAEFVTQTEADGEDTVS